MAIQVRRGKEDELDISKAVPGEWLVSTDTRYVRMCFAPGIVLRMATYEAFEADMAQIQAILEEAKTVEEAIQKIYDDVQQVVIDIETASSAAQTAIEKSEESKEFATAAASSASAAKTSETNAKSSASSASTSASTATKKATEASTYANNAKNSENTANTHATTASNKASEASTSANTASVKANDASDSALLAESYTHGGTGVRDNEDVDNAQYYKNQAERISQGLSGALLPMGTITFSQLANQTKQAGYMYNISNSFTTDNTFKEGAGYSYPEGTNVYYTADGYWDCIAGTSVVGVKGSAESSYRKGNVNITKSNIGLSNVDNTSDADKPISDATQAALGEVNERIDESVLDLQAQIDATNSNLSVTTYTMTMDTSAVTGSYLYVGKQGNCYYISAGIFPTFDSIEAWSNQKIGTIANWSHGILNGFACLNAIGYAPTINIPTLGLRIEEDGTVYVYVHGTVSGIKNMWFYASTAIYKF